jgi:hypothetical protein
LGLNKKLGNFIPAIKRLKLILAVMGFLPLLCLPICAQDKTNDYSESGNRAALKFQEQNILQAMEKKGAPPDEIASQKEIYKLMDDGAPLKTWDDWKKVYHADILKTPVVFDVRDPFQMDFGNPISAFHSFERALLIGDASTLLRFADASGSAWLKRSVKVDENVKKPTYWFPVGKLTRITVLLTGQTKSDNNEYSLIFWRAENAENPTNGPITYQHTIFVRKQAGVYLVTQDLDQTPFGDILGIAHADDAGLLLYNDNYEAMKNSSFPPSFYTIK